MPKIEGVAKKFDGTPIDYVSIFNWSDGKCIAQVVPDATGAWEHEYYLDLNIGITYVADGCEPLTHGAYELEGAENLIVNGSFDNDLSGWVNGGNHYKWVDGRAHHPRGSNYNVFSQEIINKGTVRVVADIEVLSGKALYFVYSATSGYMYPLVELGIGFHKIDFTSPTNADSYFGIARLANTGSVEFYIDNVFVIQD